MFSLRLVEVEFWRKKIAFNHLFFRFCFVIYSLYFFPFPFSNFTLSFSPPFRFVLLYFLLAFSLFCFHLFFFLQLFFPPNSFLVFFSVPFLFFCPSLILSRPGYFVLIFSEYRRVENAWMVVGYAAPNGTRDQ